MSGARLVLPLLLVAACGGKPAPKTPTPEPDPIPKTAGPPCAAVADKVAIVVLGGAQGDGKLKTDLRTACERDRWSDEVRSCFAAMENDSEGAGCVGKLPAQQRDGVAALVASRDADDGGSGTAMPLEEGKMGKREPTAKDAATTKDTAPARTRGAVRKAAPKPKDADPCQGGE